MADPPTDGDVASSGAATTEMPPKPGWPGHAVGEREMLTGFLDAYRTILLRKASGLTGAQLSTRLAPSSLTLGGLLKHLALVEDDWFQSDFLGLEIPEPWRSADWAADRDWELNSAADDTPEELVALYVAACDRSRAAIAGAALDDLSVRADPEGRQWSLRWILIHMIEEYARHAGHADLIRESIDGATGN